MPPPSHSMRIPPQNTESEKALLGSLMLRQDAFHECSDLVSPEAFYSEKHKIIYKSISDLHERKEPIDVLSLSSRLKEKEELKIIGGRAYLAELLNNTPSATNAKYYAEIVQKKFILRKLIEASDFIGELGYDEAAQLEDTIDSAEKTIFKISGLTSGKKFLALKDSLEEAWERLDKLHKSDEKMRGVPTGYAKLDALLSGLQKSDLIILAARPSVGKTALALDIARNAACRFNVPVGIFSLEMSSQQLVDRLLAAESRVDSWKLRTGKLNSDKEFVHIQNALDQLSRAPIFFDDTPAHGILQMRSAARQLKREHDVKLLIVDYLQLITTPRSYDSMVQQVTEISRALKSLARELDIPVLALSQLSRAIEQRRDKPRLSDLRDSGSIEQDSDVVMFIHREDKYKDPDEKTNIVEIMVAKHRNGPTGNIELYFDEKRTSFLDVEAHMNDISDSETEKEEAPF
jgi:replicative DNA helicase